MQYGRTTSHLFPHGMEHHHSTSLIGWRKRAESRSLRPLHFFMAFIARAEAAAFAFMAFFIAFVTFMAFIAFIAAIVV